MANPVSDEKGKMLAEELYARKRAHESLIDFTKYIDVPGAPVSTSEESNSWVYEPIETGIAAHHILILDVMQKVIMGKIPRAMFFLPPGSAKALALDTPIPTPDGWITMGELKVGDQVFGDDGRPCNVTWKSPVFKDRPCFDVRTDCNDTIVADNDHEWLVRLCGKPRKPLVKDQDRKDRRGLACLSNRDDPMSQFKIKETWELARRRAKKPMIKRAGALELPEADLLIDPYLLGIWLGDGTSASGAITASVDDIGWLRKEIESLGYETKDRSIDTLFGVKGLQAQLRELGLLKLEAANAYGRKHIPAHYLRASYAQRLSLLQGLIDSDGTICRKRGCSTFCNTNKELALQVRELVRTLGVKAGWSESPAKLNGKECGICYKVSFYLEGSARLPRKAVLTRNQYRTPNTYIEVTPTTNTDTVCIEVDSPSHLFLAGESMTPTHNSTFCSSVAPVWAMGRLPNTKIILASYGGELAKKHGRKARAIVKSKKYQSVFSVSISEDTSAADMWATSNDSEYMSAGILSGITGNRANGLIIDDPIKGRADADSKVVRDKTWDAYQDDLRTRLVPGGWEIVVQCMTGDTPVLMTDGTEKRLDLLSVGERVASWNDGKYAISKVLNHKSNGFDFCWEIRTSSGRVVVANERHPFLVNHNGENKWVRLKNLRLMQQIVTLKDSTENGKAKSAKSMVVKSLLAVGGFVENIIHKLIGEVETGRHHPEQTRHQESTQNSSIGMALPLKNLRKWLNRKVEFVQYAISHLKKQKTLSTGSALFVLITVMILEKFVGCCAIAVTFLSKSQTIQKCLRGQLFTSESIVSIKPAGRREVFDVQIDKTENFIANGLVSHNTRWHEDDLSGRLLPKDYDGESGMLRCEDGRDWYILNIPAQCENKDDPLNREIGEYLWPEWFTAEHFEGFKKQTRTWSALFQQRPSPDEGTFFKREWFHLFQSYELPRDLHYYITSDFATKADEGDFTEHGVWGIDERGDIWLVDWWYGQTTADTWITELLALMQVHKPMCWFGEGGVIRRAIEPFLTRMMTDDEAYCRIEWINPVTDKATRSRAFQSMASRGKVHFPDSLMGHRVIDQLLAFPVGAHDDAVDVCSLMGMVIDQAHPAVVNRKNERPKTQAEKDWARIHGVEDEDEAINVDDI